MRRRLGLALALMVMVAPSAQAATCGSTSAGFAEWKEDFAAEARARGAGRRAIAALKAATYATGTIRADRSQKSFKLSLDVFLAKRGAAGIVARGRALKRANAALFAALERRYGVPAGPLIAIWGMETGFGSNTGGQNTLSAVATLAYDCRRPEYFTEHLHAALKLIDRGVMSASTRGAMHGEIGQTQFLPKNVLLYGADGDGNGSVNLNSKADALASTARFLSGQGWPAGGPYRAGAFATWNAASVYQKALAIIATKIDSD
jgi:lytic murein transglycosylase